MATLSGTYIVPRPGEELQARKLLEEMDSISSGSRGLLFSLVLASDQYGRLSRISLWQSRGDAAKAAQSPETKLVRQQLREIASNLDENLLDVKSGFLRDAMRELSGRSAAEPTRIGPRSPVYQPALLAS